MKLSFFGNVVVPDGAIALMDGGIHGVQGHTIVLAPDGGATWERRLDGFMPSGKPGAGSFVPSAVELAQLREWIEPLWQLAAGEASFFASFAHGPPRWVWAIVLCRSDETRALQGGDVARPRSAPSAAVPLLDWLVERVDALAG